MNSSAKPLYLRTYIVKYYAWCGFYSKSMNRGSHLWFGRGSRKVTSVRNDYLRMGTSDTNAAMENRYIRPSKIIPRLHNFDTLKA